MTIREFKTVLQMQNSYACTEMFVLLFKVAWILLSQLFIHIFRLKKNFFILLALILYFLPLLRSIEFLTMLNGCVVHRLKP